MWKYLCCHVCVDGIDLRNIIMSFQGRVREFTTSQHHKDLNGFSCWTHYFIFFFVLECVFSLFSTVNSPNPFENHIRLASSSYASIIHQMGKQTLDNSSKLKRITEWDEKNGSKKNLLSWSFDQSIVLGQKLDRTILQIKV